MSSWLRFLAALFFSYHLLAIAAINFPVENRLAEKLQRPFIDYLRTTAQLQTWDMFDSKPDDHKFEVTAFVVGANGQEKKIGPVTPGLGEVGGELRLTTFFYRLHPDAPEPAIFWNTYSARLCAAVRTAKSNFADVPPPYELWLDFTSHHLRTLEQIRAGGEMTEKWVSTRGPVKCE